MEISQKVNNLSVNGRDCFNNTKSSLIAWTSISREITCSIEGFVLAFFFFFITILFVIWSYQLDDSCFLSSHAFDVCRIGKFTAVAGKWPTIEMEFARTTPVSTKLSSSGQVLLCINSSFRTWSIGRKFSRQRQEILWRGRKRRRIKRKKKKKKPYRPLILYQIIQSHGLYNSNFFPLLFLLNAIHVSSTKEREKML